jgi:hypothetical protein
MRRTPCGSSLIKELTGTRPSGEKQFRWFEPANGIQAVIAVTIFCIGPSACRARFGRRAAAGPRCSSIDVGHHRLDEAEQVLRETGLVT